MSMLLHQANLRRWIQAQSPGVRISKEFLLKLEAIVKAKTKAALTIPSNRKTLRDILP